MSASETGSFGFLFHDFTPLRKKRSATAPASRVAASRSSCSCLREPAMTRLPARDGHAVDAQGRRIGAEAEFEVVCRRDTGEHLLEIPGNGDFRDRLRQFAIDDQEPGRAAAVIAGDAV